MMFKKKTGLALLLFIVIVVFSVWSEYNITNHFRSMVGIKEGYDEDVPSCGYNEPVPTCSTSLIDDSTVYGYGYDDNYILKTEIVPPVCPACPSLINGHSHEEEVSGNTPILGTGPISQSSVVSSNEEVNNTSTSNITNTQIYNTNNNGNGTPEEDNASTMNQSENMTTKTNEQYEKEIQDLKAELNKLKQSNGSNGTDSCPPCPPCDRCPEPSFSCEKVINYRSPNVGNYLPLPVLNDFSSFDSQ